MSVIKNWNFTLHEGDLSFYQKAKMAIARANNNLKYGFDGSREVFQLGSLKGGPNPRREAEAKLVKLLNDKSLFRMLASSVLSGGKLIKENNNARKLKDLYEDSRAKD